jgi:hypothetical protein
VSFDTGRPHSQHNPARMWRNWYWRCRDIPLTLLGLCVLVLAFLWLRNLSESFLAVHSGNA